MKNLILFLFFPFISTFSQNKNCIFEVDVVNDSTYTKVLPQKTFDEVIVGDNTYILSGKLFVVDGKLGFNIQYLQKSKEFIPVFCMDKDSKMTLSLSNSKEVTLINANDDEKCNDLNYNPDNKDYFRILDVYFNFTKENFEFLKTEKVNLITIKGTTGEISFVMKSQIISELLKETYNPEMYFIENLRCFDIN